MYVEQVNVVIEFIARALELVGLVISRMAGIARIALGVGCWPAGASVVGLLVYSALATPYLACLPATGAPFGALLRPIVAVHAILTLLLVWAWTSERRGPGLGSENISGNVKR